MIIYSRETVQNQFENLLKSQFKLKIQLRNYIKFSNKRVLTGLNLSFLCGRPVAPCRRSAELCTYVNAGAVLARVVHGFDRHHSGMVVSLLRAAGAISLYSGDTIQGRIESRWKPEGGPDGKIIRKAISNHHTPIWAVSNTFLNTRHARGLRPHSSSWKSKKIFKIFKKSKPVEIQKWLEFET